ncbi:MAG: zinc carboxypeptidase, partial [Bacteroidales bacterium]|nr:zinc carboxypeptidase [Bacteroidales bacterium]
MKKIITILMFVLFAGNFFAQTDMDNIFKDTPEVIFKFKITEKNELADLTRIISIDKIQDNEVTAYANRQEFERFLAKKIPYEIVERPHLTPEEANMKTFEQICNAKANTWDYYPTYEAYIAMMQQFATDYPELCAIEEIGTTVQNRKLLVARISKNVHTREAEPQYFWSSTMHGDETTGYIVLLRFIDYLLSNYGSNARITNILDKMEIYICPNANPDGTYYGGNSTVSNARRYNKNGVDLNRNYKDFRNGDHPDGASWQPETVAFMNWQGTKNLTMSCNIHGGTEVCNYPWDDYATNSPGSQYTVDKNWWIRICKQYADTAMYWSNYYGFSDSPKYMKYDFSSGSTHGLDW